MWKKESKTIELKRKKKLKTECWFIMNENWVEVGMKPKWHEEEKGKQQIKNFFFLNNENKK